jgi:hypothetical protein
MPVASLPPPGSPLAGAAQPAIERSEASAIRGLRLPQRGSWPAVAIARLIDRDYASGINLRRAYAVEVPASQQRWLVQHMPLPTLAQVAQNRWIGVRWRRDSMRMIHRERQLLVQLTSPSAALIQQFHIWLDFCGVLPKFGKRESTHSARICVAIPVPQPPATVITATFGLGPSEVATVAAQFGGGALSRPEVVLSKGYTKTRRAKTASARSTWTCRSPKLRLRSISLRTSNFPSR